VESPDGRVVVVGDAQELAGVVVADGVDARASGHLEQAGRGSAGWCRALRALPGNIIITGEGSRAMGLQEGGSALRLGLGFRKRR
jgi:hypothetical protein